MASSGGGGGGGGGEQVPPFPWSGTTFTLAVKQIPTTGTQTVTVHIHNKFQYGMDSPKSRLVWVGH